MQIQLTDGYITGFAEVGGFPDGIEVSADFLAGLETEKLGCYRYQDGQAVLDEEKWQAAQAVGQQDRLRARRAAECFPIINRGKPWYDGLTGEQTEELTAWYHAWLDAPQTGTAPEALGWIDG